MRIKLLPDIILETKGNLVSWFALTAVSRGQINILDTSRHADNVQVLVNMASMYVTKDLARILINRRIAKTTVLHHVCVFIAYGYVLRSEMKIVKRLGLGLGTWDLGPGTWDLGPGTWDLGPRT